MKARARKAPGRARASDDPRAPRAPFSRRLLRQAKQAPRFRGERRPGRAARTIRCANGRRTHDRLTDDRLRRAAPLPGDAPQIACVMRHASENPHGFRLRAMIAVLWRGGLRFAPHQLRHAHAVELAREGVSLHAIQRQLGHVNLGTTSIYLQGMRKRGPRPETRWRLDRQLGTVAPRPVRRAAGRGQTSPVAGVQSAEALPDGRPCRWRHGAWSPCAIGPLSLGRTRSRPSARDHRAESPRRRAAARSGC
jgi:hypothetical protein